MADLAKYGWNDFFEQAFLPYREQGFSAGRVAVENRDGFILLSSFGELSAESTGRLHYTSETKADLPKVGDWVVITRFEEDNKAVIHHVLPRQTKFSRKVAGRHVREQVIAANLSTIFVVQSMNDNFSIGRLERSLIMINEGGATPVVILNKEDLCSDPQDYIESARATGEDITVMSISAVTGNGLAELQDSLRPGETYAFIGSSGVGKTTLINCLLDEEKLRTTEIREKDAKGRHTTTRRELILLPNGAMVIDTPGMRELALWETSDGLQDTFSDIDELSSHCHFSDCTHTHEIKCAIRSAVDIGDISDDRYQNYLKYQEELVELDEKRKQRALLDKKREEKVLHRRIKDLHKVHPKYKK